MNESKATRYQRYRRRSHVAAMLASALALSAIALSPLGGVLAARARGVGALVPEPVGGVVTLALFLAAVGTACELAAVPVRLYEVLAIDPRYGGRQTSIREAVAAQIQNTLVVLPVVLVAGGAIRLAILLAGPWWWLAAAAALTLLLVLALHGAPTLIAGIGGAHPLRRPSLEARLSRLADTAGVRVAGVDELDVADDDRATALVTGVGRRRRIFVASTLLRDWSEDEVVVVVAHELGHHARRHLWRSVGVDALTMVLSFGVAAFGLRLLSSVGLPPLERLDSLPVVAVFAGLCWMAATPIRHAISRRQEREADAFALATTGGVDAFQAVIRRLAARQLREDRPSALARWLYHRHPTVEERLAMADEWRQRELTSKTPRSSSRQRSSMVRLQ